MRSNKKKGPTLEILASVLEDFGTAQILTSPTSDDQAKAKESLKQFPMEELIRDLAIITASKMADVLQSKALRPADYAILTMIPQTLKSEIVSNLKGKGAQFFEQVFMDHLKKRG